MNFYHCTNIILNTHHVSLLKAMALLQILVIHGDAEHQIGAMRQVMAYYSHNIKTAGRKLMIRMRT